MFKYQLPRFSVITMPQRSSRKSTGLTEICEEIEGEEDAEMEEAENVTDDNASIAGSETSVEKRMTLNPEARMITLNTSEDPLKRFQVQNYSIF